MSGKWIKIGVFVLLILGMIVNLNLAVGRDGDKRELRLENVEALAALESGGVTLNCKSGRGFCFVHGVLSSKIRITD